MPNFSKNLTLALTTVLARSLRRLDDHTREGLARRFGRERDRADVQGLAFFARCLAAEFYGVTNYASVNGESWLIQRTACLNFQTIFDVGANVGEWATDALQHHPQARLHCFEIVPSTFEILRETLAPFANRTVLNAFGLSDQAAEVKIFINPESSLVSSLYAFGSGDRRMTVQGRLHSGSDYVREQRISHIDYLKIDVEGAEALVLKGLAPELQAGRIRLLHFEYNRGALESRFLLKDFYALLEPVGYCLGKLYPDGVLFQDYRWEMEDFMGPNYVACRRDDKEMQQLLKLRRTSLPTP